MNTGEPSWPDILTAGQRVQRMQAKLHRWARGNASRRFDDLFNLICDPAFLTLAWERVRTNKGGRTPGVDRVVPAFISEPGDVAEFLAETRQQLRSGTFAPLPVEGGGHKGEPELDRLSNILKTFNENFATLFTDADRVAKRIRDDIAPKVAADAAYQNAKENTPHTARMAHDQALGKVMQHLLKDDTQVYKQFVENESFRRFVGDMVYHLTQ